MSNGHIYNKNIPVHALKQNDFPFVMEDIAYKNPYDFTKKHRHDYLEIILLREGGGRQWIDFTQIEMQDNSCYIILPKQVHLLRRNENTKGFAIQCLQTFLNSSHLLNYLQQLNQPVIFENDLEKYAAISRYAELAQIMHTNKKELARHGSHHLLQAFLFHLLCLKADFKWSDKGNNIHHQFMILVENNFSEKHAVQEYTQELNISEAKLSALTRKHLGLTPLQVIHNRIVLEAKRLLAFDDQSHKEIAYQLGFKTPPQFTRFIRNKTGLTPSGLQKECKNQ